MVRSFQVPHKISQGNFGYPWEGTLAVVPKLVPHIALYNHYRTQLGIYLYYHICGICWYTLQGTNISHLGKRKIIFQIPFLGDMLVPWRVYLGYSPKGIQLFPLTKFRNHPPVPRCIILPEEKVRRFDVTMNTWGETGCFNPSKNLNGTLPTDTGWLIGTLINGLL